MLASKQESDGSAQIEKPWNDAGRSTEKARAKRGWGGSIYRLGANGPHMVCPGGRGGVLGHHPHQGVGGVGGFQRGTFLWGEGQVHRPECAGTWEGLVMPTTGEVTLVSSQAREISVMDTPRACAKAATWARMGASWSAAPSYLPLA